MRVHEGRFLRLQVASYVLSGEGLLLIGAGHGADGMLEG